MTLRLISASAIAFVCLISMADARPRSVFDTAGQVKCDDRYPSTCDVRGWRFEGRAVKRDRRHFREKRKARRGLVHSRVPARVAAVVVDQTDNNGRLIFAHPAVEPGRPAARQSRRGATKPVRLARAAQEARQPVPVVTAQILPHPEGCPRRAFCGCGAALKVFGRHIRSLWLAANWLRFPPAAPAPGMVAARRGHVFVIEAVVGNGRVLAYDANSGRGKTRRHVRSLAGYSVRNPHSG